MAETDRPPVGVTLETQAPSAQWLRRWAIALLRWGIAAVVVLGIGRRIWLEKERLGAYDLRPAPLGLVLAGVSYAVGLAPCALFWWWAMRDAGARPGWARTLAAYYAGHLGKYVPGKALVLVVRGGMMAGPRVSLAVAAVTAVHETVLMMATGAAVAGALLVWVDLPQLPLLAGIAWGLAGALGLAAMPPVMARLGQAATAAFRQMGSADTTTCRWRTVAAGTGLIALGWFCMGLSLAGVLWALHEPPEIWQRWDMLTAVAALATVGGFVSLTPGGLGSREWVLVETLAPHIGADHALVAAILLRLVWVTAEASAAGGCWVAARMVSRSTTTQPHGSCHPT